VRKSTGIERAKSSESFENKHQAKLLPAALDGRSKIQKNKIERRCGHYLFITILMPQ
jgi:hypothetical protein